MLYKRCNLDTNSSTATLGPVDMTFENLRPGQAKPRLSVRKTGGEDLGKKRGRKRSGQKTEFLHAVAKRVNAEIQFFGGFRLVALGNLQSLADQFALDILNVDPFRRNS